MSITIASGAFFHSSIRHAVSAGVCERSSTAIDAAARGLNAETYKVWNAGLFELVPTYMQRASKVQTWKALNAVSLTVNALSLVKGYMKKIASIKTANGKVVSAGFAAHTKEVVKYSQICLVGLWHQVIEMLSFDRALQE